MASLQFLLRPSSPPDLDRFDVPTNARRCLTALLLFTIMYAFTLITISRHIVGFYFFWILFCLFNFLILNYIYSFLSLGQHRIWKRMAVSWSGWLLYFTFLSLFSFIIDLSFFFFKFCFWKSGSGPRGETMCWICVVEVGIWHFYYQKELGLMARFLSNSGLS